MAFGVYSQTVYKTLTQGVKTMATIRVESFDLERFCIVAEREVPREGMTIQTGGIETFTGQKTEKLYWSGRKWLDPAFKAQAKTFPSEKKAKNEIKAEGLRQRLPSGWQDAMTDPEKKNVIDQLRAYEKLFDELLELVRDHPLRGAKKTEAQQKMRALKEKLKAEYKAGDTVKGQQGMNKWEKSCLHPTIHRAYAGIMVRWNTNPNGDWFDQLYSGHCDITHMLYDLEH